MRSDRNRFQMFAGYPPKLFQNRTSLEHFLNGVWTQKIVIDIIQSVRVFPFVTFRPLLSIANGTHTSQIHSRNQISRVPLLDQIRERKIGGIGRLTWRPITREKAPTRAGHKI